MAAGTPVVASDLDGYKNVATHGKDALLVEPGDALALANALHRVLEEPALAAQLKAAGCRRAEEFSMRSLALAYVRLYEEAVASFQREQDEPSPAVTRWRGKSVRMMQKVRGG
jgi:phosphatidyl-myo-inositol alpha-mannosyltransferase